MKDLKDFGAGFSIAAMVVGFVMALSVFFADDIRNPTPLVWNGSYEGTQR